MVGPFTDTPGYSQKEEGLMYIETLAEKRSSRRAVGAFAVVGATVWMVGVPELTQPISVFYHVDCTNWVDIRGQVEIVKHVTISLSYLD